MYNKKYTFMYKINFCCHYISSYIIINKYCNYTSSCITQEYTFMYKRNVCCHYISSYIIINKYLLSLYIVLYNEEYTFMYNKNKYCYYIREYIITIFIFIIHESVFLLY